MKNNHTTLSIHGLLTGVAVTLLGAALQSQAAPMPAIPPTSTASDMTISAPVEPKYNPDEAPQQSQQMMPKSLQGLLTVPIL